MKNGLSVFDLERAVLTGEIVERERDHLTRENPSRGTDDFGTSKLKEKTREFQKTFMK